MANLLVWLIVVLQAGSLKRSESFDKAIVIVNNSAKPVEVFVENPIEATLFPFYARHVDSKLLVLCSERESFSLNKLIGIKSDLFLSSAQGPRFQLLSKAPDIEEILAIKSPAALRKMLGKPYYSGSGYIEDLDSKLIRHTSFYWKKCWFDKGQVCLLDAMVLSRIEVVGPRGTAREKEADFVARSEVDSPQEELELFSLKSSDTKYKDKFRNEKIERQR